MPDMYLIITIQNNSVEYLTLNLHPKGKGTALSLTMADVYNYGLSIRSKQCSMNRIYRPLQTKFGVQNMFNHPSGQNLFPVIQNLHGDHIYGLIQPELDMKLRIRLGMS
jgi:hypothetical protein